MNGFILAWLVLQALGLGMALNRWNDGDGWIKLSTFDIFFGPALSIALLYLGGAFT
jgi:hypothetical protein